MTRLAHISDLHVSRTPGFGELTLKRAVGYVNYRLNRSLRHSEDKIEEAIQLLVDDPPHIVAATGDLAQTGLDSEFGIIRKYFEPLVKRNIPVIIVGGNHDLYGGKVSPSWVALREYLALGLVPDKYGIIHFEDLEILPLEQWVKSPIFFSYGKVDPSVLYKALELWRTPAVDKARVVLGHYPVVMKGGTTSSFVHGLKKWKELLAFLRAAQVSGYLCGHIHKRKKYDLGEGVIQYAAPSLTVDGKPGIFESSGSRVQFLSTDQS